MAAGAFGELIALAARSPALLDHDEAAFQVGLAHIYTGAHAAGETVLRRLIERDPNLLAAKAALCRLYVVEGRIAEADALFAALEHDVAREPRAGGLSGKPICRPSASPTRRAPSRR